MMKKSKICVIGAGIIGLSSAVLIQEKIPDADITIIADTFTPHTCSDGSGGFWELFLLPKDAVDQARAWCKDTWDVLFKLVNSADAGSFGAHLVSGYNFTDIHKPNDPIWKDIVLGYRYITEDERKLHPENKDGVFYTTIMINVKKYLPWLMARFRNNNGKVINRKIERIQEVYMNYTLPRNMTLLLIALALELMTLEIHRLYLYEDRLLGKDYVVLGGTSQSGDWDTDIRETDTRRILDGCSRLVPSLKNAKILEQWTGLRPSRPSVRMDTERILVDGRYVSIVHNYGHAGSGITIHWGCAKDTAETVKKIYTTKEDFNGNSKL